jgi:penicillin-binding protein 2
MKQSCDVWFYQKGMATGVDDIERVAREFGLGEQTGLDIGREYEGLMPNPDWKRKHRGERWWDGDTAQLSIGQSFLQVTPIQMAVVAAAFANGGQVLRPFVVRRAEAADGRVIQDTQPLVRRRVRVAQSDMQIVRQTLLGAVQEPDGTAHRAAVAGLRVAGKTGTAEFDTQQGRIKRAWFIGFAPYDAPQVAVAVVIEDAGSGGHDAAPLAGKILAGTFGKQTTNPGAGGVYAD